MISGLYTDFSLEIYTSIAYEGKNQQNSDSNVDNNILSNCHALLATITFNAVAANKTRHCRVLFAALLTAFNHRK